MFEAPGGRKWPSIGKLFPLGIESGWLFVERPSCVRAKLLAIADSRRLANNERPLMDWRSLAGRLATNKSRPNNGIQQPLAAAVWQLKRWPPSGQRWMHLHDQTSDGNHVSK